MDYSTTVPFNVTTAGPPAHQLAAGYGFLAIAVSAIGFGVNYLPVKKFETGDGMFFQWVLANAIFLGSLVVGGIFKFPKFEPLVLLGGVLWATGNICVVPIVRLIGLGLGLLLWSSANLVVGWASARFGWFGIFPQVPNNLTLNYIGFFLTAISPFIYSMVKTEVSEEIIVNVDLYETEEIITNNENINISSEEIHTRNKTEKMKKLKKKIIAVALSVFSGTLYGLMFIPVTYVKNRYENSSQRDIDYLFAQCCGIHMTSSFYFIIYCIYKRNKPMINPECILPGLASGIIWFIAYVGFFFANEALSPAISQPIISALPGLIGVIITTVIFKEIRGWRNYLMIGVAILITSVGVILTGLSKIL